MTNMMHKIVIQTMISDGDGFSNIDEVNVGTDPNDYDDKPSNFSELNFEIANFLSPNGDGINDTWYEPSIQRYPNNKVMIYSRSGKLIYERNNYLNDWNGTSNGKGIARGSVLLPH